MPITKRIRPAVDSKITKPLTGEESLLNSGIYGPAPSYVIQAVFTANHTDSYQSGGVYVNVFTGDVNNGMDAPLSFINGSVGMEVDSSSDRPHGFMAPTFQVFLGGRKLIKLVDYQLTADNEIKILRHIYMDEIIEIWF